MSNIFCVPQNEVIHVWNDTMIEFSFFIPLIIATIIDAKRQAEQ